ncbi:hypothetical protein [Actinomadura decatromicini]|uniref:Uncharacterized protein n=1 Tax=Actinomadura decatromicini TaxID=2604572 RepID=A0A5D3FJE1_9ACTN|nr:hypothetical protein [Actinomadura decatromicini]TYK48957.1 hypothetical protein FXF68_13990 [Actinomadura decatromicini]
MARESTMSGTVAASSLAVAPVTPAHAGSYGPYGPPAPKRPAPVPRSADAVQRRPKASPGSKLGGTLVESRAYSGWG